MKNGYVLYGAGQVLNVEGYNVLAVRVLLSAVSLYIHNRSKSSLALYSLLYLFRRILNHFGQVLLLAVLRIDRYCVARAYSYACNCAACCAYGQSLSCQKSNNHQCCKNLLSHVSYLHILS